MNPSIVVQPPQGNSTTTLSSSNAANSASVLVQLEQKYGMKKLRLDAGQSSPPRSRRRRAHKFKQYTEWLTHHLNNPSSELSQVTVARGDQSRPAQIESGIEYASHSTTEFDTHVTVSQDLLDPQTETVNAPQLPELLSEGIIQTDMSMPVDNSNLAMHRLSRIDNAHSTQSVVQPARRDRSKTSGTVFELKPAVYDGLNSATVNANPPTDLFSRTQTSSSDVAWEVHDFSWPPVVDQIGNTDTKAARSLVETAMQVLGTSQQRLAIVGSGRGPGTTTIAMYLAKILAGRQKRVLLIDADMSKPDLTRRLGIVSELSWLNAVNGKQQSSHSIVHAFKSGISVMPVQKIATPAIWPRFVYDRLGEIVEKVRQKFDFVLIDIGPVSQIVRELSRPNLLVDAAMLVHNVRLPDHTLFVRNQNELTSFGIKRLVVAENFSPGAA